MNHNAYLRQPHVACFVLIALIGALAAPALGSELFVNCGAGNDEAAATADAPVRTIARAVDLAQPGDVIHLLPEGAVYREQISLIDKSDLTIEGHGCTVTGADPLPSDPSAWENVGENLHRIQLDRTREDRHMLVIDGQAQRMGLTKFDVGRVSQMEKNQGWEAVREKLIAMYPRPEELEDGQFAWEPTDRDTGFLYVKGSLQNLEWTTRTEGVYTFGHTHNVTIRDLHVRHVLNDGFNVHGDTQNLRLINVSGNECFDNGVSPHGACSMIVEDSEFLRNGLAVGHGHVTRTRFTRCLIGDSLGIELMIVGGEHVLEDCTIRGSAPVIVRFIFATPREPYLLKEIEMADQSTELAPRYVMRNCSVTGAGRQPSAFKVEHDVDVRLDACTFTNVTMQIDPAAVVQTIGCAFDGEPSSTAPVPVP